ncbi:aldehyde dehydrogenase [Ferrimicrobium sp.]|uniref:aldehyde dehydrogenase n=1 Tax=Ferrimicrobium sp. TaxID=2926050 RepID=UPI00260C01E7|nr:aldehyde dehydrogenase [Ferrimicrobium sp.]MCL5973875.1 aldehyde dehydrogenase [Actinomycetota bacterium]
MSNATLDWHQRAKELQLRNRLWIDGGFIDSSNGKTFSDYSPIDGRLLTEVAAGGRQDIDLAVKAARRSFEAGVWSRIPAQQRKAVLLRWADLIREHAEELALLETLDVGKPIGESLRVDVASAASCIQWYGEAIDKIYGEVGPSRTQALSLVEREPLGVIGAVVPWNYPLIISAWKLAPALAAGNSVVLKPAEQSPLSALLLGELAEIAGLPAGVLNVVPGLGPEAGAALGLHPDVVKIAFTGSNKTGRFFLKYAAESNMKQVSLELGGKSPQIVFNDLYDLDATIASISAGIYYNQGQTCNAGSLLLMQRNIADAILDGVVDAAKALHPTNPLDPDCQLGAIVSEEQLKTILSYIEQGKADGGDIVVGGQRVLEETGGTYLLPTVLDQVETSMSIYQEEIFGPVLSCVRFDTEEEALSLASATKYGLAAGIWTTDLKRAHRVSQQLRAGTVWVNTFDASDITVPFGGYKASGSGRDKSLHAFEGYTQLKTTWFDLS